MGTAGFCYTWCQPGDSKAGGWNHPRSGSHILGSEAGSWPGTLPAVGQSIYAWPFHEAAWASSQHGAGFPE